MYVCTIAIGLKFGMIILPGSVKPKIKPKPKGLKALIYSFRVVIVCIKWALF